MSKTVVVAGDLIRDVNLLRMPAPPSTPFQDLPSAVARATDGGAWYLRRLVALACADLDRQSPERVSIVDAQPPESHPPAAEAFTIWSPHPRLRESREEAWRVQQFLGCHSPQTTPAAPIDSTDLQPIDLLVLDDNNLGFRSDPMRWEPLLATIHAETHVVLKTVAPLCESRLWRRLIDDGPNRLTVVLHVAALRGRNAVISQGLSWERTIEDLQREFREGRSARDLARAERVAVLFGGTGAGLFLRSDAGLELRHFIFHPDEFEGSWTAARPGVTFGATSILASSIARHVLDPQSFPLFLAGARALAAIRRSHDIGGGRVQGPAARAMLESFDPDAAGAEILSLLHPRDSSPDTLPESAFRSAFPRRLLFQLRSDAASEPSSDLLQDVTGPGYEYVAAKAMQIVLEGLSPALDSVPKARYGNLVTVDREEIERLNEIRRLIVLYQANSADRRPLSIAVFGPAGCGKSFAIREIAKTLFGHEQSVFEFNLSQFGGREELHRAFDLIRDTSVKGQIPLVFWDEFDTDSLRWLAEFLAPMQDAEYRASGTPHPFGKAIFIFAGSTRPDFQSFDQSSASDDARETFRRVKGPDFVSRLRGYVNIKGPNPVSSTNPASGAVLGDTAYLIRRAILVRSLLERAFPRLIDAASGAASVDAGIARGILRARAFHHGARSLEAILSMSSLAGADHFGVAQLPSADLLSLHVTSDFSDLVRQSELEAAAIELIAGSIHEAWREERTQQGYVHGPERDDDALPPTNPLLLPYAELAERHKEANRLSARVTLAKLAQIGCRVVPSTGGPASIFSDHERAGLRAIEHDIWLRDHLLRGYEYAGQTHDNLRQHRDIVPFRELLPDPERDLENAIVESLPRALQEAGYTIDRSPTL